MTQTSTSAAAAARAAVRVGGRGARSGGPGASATASAASKAAIARLRSRLIVAMKLASRSSRRALHPASGYRAALPPRGRSCGRRRRDLRAAAPVALTRRAVCRARAGRRAARVGRRQRGLAADHARVAEERLARHAGWRARAQLRGSSSTPRRTGRAAVVHLLGRAERAAAGGGGPALQLVRLARRRSPRTPARRSSARSRAPASARRRSAAPFCAPRATGAILWRNPATSDAIFYLASQVHVGAPRRDAPRLPLRRRRRRRLPDGRRRRRRRHRRPPVRCDAATRCRPRAHPLSARSPLTRRRRFGKVKWPFSDTKSYAGTGAFVVGAWAASLGVVSVYHRVHGADGAGGVCCSPSVASALVELLPKGQA